MILDFVNLKNVKNADYLAVSIPEAFIEPLEESGSFEVLERSVSQRAVKELKVHKNKLYDKTFAAQIGRRTKCEVVIIGSFLVVGDTVQIQARAVDVKTARVKVTKKKRGKLDSSVFKTIDKLVAKMVKKMKKTLPPLPQREIIREVVRGDNHFRFFLSPSMALPMGFVKDGFGIGFGLNAKAEYLFTKSLFLGVNGGFYSYTANNANVQSFTAIPVQGSAGYDFSISTSFVLTGFLLAGIDIGKYASNANTVNYLVPSFGAGGRMSYFFTKRLAAILESSYSAQYDKELNGFIYFNAGVGYGF